MMKKLTAEHCDCYLCENQKCEHGYQCPKCKMIFSANHYLTHAYHHNLCPNCLNVKIDKFKVVENKERESNE